MRSLLIAIIAGAALAAQDTSNARAIIEESQNRHRTDSQRYEGLLQVVDQSGKVADKRWISERLGAWGNSKLVLRFTAPAEVKGVAMLVVNHADRASDQWMYTPAVGRERRIALQDRSTRFFGTDFSFEDLEERDVDQSVFSMSGEEPVDGAPCWRIAAKPKESKRSQYSESRIWVRKDNYVVARVESFVKDQLARRLSYKQIERVQGVWSSRLWEMEDFRRKSKTVMKLERLEFNVKLKDDAFTLAALRQ